MGYEENVNKTEIRGVSALIFRRPEEKRVLYMSKEGCAGPSSVEWWLAVRE